jgi:hypothetical protein
LVGIVALRRQLASLPDEVKNHFWKLEALLDDNHLEIALAYIFMLLEQGRYRTIKTILVRKLRCPAVLVDSMYRAHRFKRETFAKSVNDLIQVDLNAGQFASLSRAEEVRDSIFHGRRPADEQLRVAISNALQFVSDFGEAVRLETGKNPFGDLRGLTSRLQMLNNTQASWIIKGVKLSSEVKP